MSIVEDRACGECFDTLFVCSECRDHFNIDVDECVFCDHCDCGFCEQCYAEHIADLPHCDRCKDVLYADSEDARSCVACQRTSCGSVRCQCNCGGRDGGAGI